ncbi:helix-turn-helix transcriptional regulator [Thermaurantiacus tibetensis]|uniref:helix-turn-helix transcriptional regulator n=1 Tax=Thermaurantiacus tibetensis TaxID=2759035 RepID=UPI00188F1CE3|nr:AlpA family phage regulatory protein [Thermaurantiacus tibetensis]
MLDSTDLSAPAAAGSIPDRILTIFEVVALTSLSRASIYRGMAEGWFPQQTRLSPGRVGWPASTIARWLRERAGTSTRPARPPSRRRRR